MYHTQEIILIIYQHYICLKLQVQHLGTFRSDTGASKLVNMKRMICTPHKEALLLLYVGKTSYSTLSNPKVNIILFTSKLN